MVEPAAAAAAAAAGTGRGAGASAAGVLRNENHRTPATLPPQPRLLKYLGVPVSSSLPLSNRRRTVWTGKGAVPRGAGRGESEKSRPKYAP